MGRTGGVVCKDGGGLLVVGGHGGMVCGSACVMSVKIAALGRRGCPAGERGEARQGGQGSNGTLAGPGRSCRKNGGLTGSDRVREGGRIGERDMKGRQARQHSNAAAQRTSTLPRKRRTPWLRFGGGKWRARGRDLTVSNWGRGCTKGSGVLFTVLVALCVCVCVCVCLYWNRFARVVWMRQVPMASGINDLERCSRGGERGETGGRCRCCVLGIGPARCLVEREKMGKAHEVADSGSISDGIG